MATNTLGTQARDLGIQAVHYIRKKVVFGDVGNTLVMGKLPAGAAVLRAAFVVKAVFDGTPTIDMGVTGTATGYLSGQAVTAIGVKAATMTTAVAAVIAPAADIDAIVKLSATNPTVGEGYAVLEYVLNNDG